MKQIIFIITITGLLIFTLGCLKDELTKAEPQQAKTHNYFNIEDFEPSGRDGGQQPFHFMTSQVEYNPFKPGAPQTAINLQRLDSTKYQRIAEPNAGAWDTNFDIYNITYYFKDGTTKTTGRIYAESVIGNSYTYIPDTDYNQLAVNNPVNYVTLTRSRKYETYSDNGCGKIKRRYFYTHHFNQDSVGFNTVDGSSCGGTFFSWQLITVE